jgi:uncharacterized protein
MSSRPGQSAAGDLLDVNVWLALAIEDHVHHSTAAAYWRADAGTTRHFCRVSSLSLVRLLTHSGLMGGSPLTLADSWRLYERFRRLPGVAFMDEPPNIEAILASIVKRRLPLRLFTDAYFAALATAAGMRLVTFDRDFARFPGVKLHRLDATAAH